MRCGIHGPGYFTRDHPLCRCRATARRPTMADDAVPGRTHAGVDRAVRPQPRQLSRSWSAAACELAQQLALPLRLGVRARVAQPAHPPWRRASTKSWRGSRALDQQAHRQGSGYFPRDGEDTVERLFRFSGPAIVPRWCNGGAPARWTERARSASRTTPNASYFGSRCSDRQADLDRQFVSQLQLSDCMQRDRLRRWPSIRWIMRSACKRKGARWTITQILTPTSITTTRAGTARWCAKPAPGYCAQECARQDSRHARGLGAGDVVKVGKTVELEALDTPGHP